VRDETNGERTSGHDAIPGELEAHSFRARAPMASIVLHAAWARRVFELGLLLRASRNRFVLCPFGNGRITMTMRTNDEPALGRRSFLRGAAFLAAAAPILTEAQLAHAAGQAAAPPSGMTLINANENPLGPSKAACDAIARVAPLGGRYDLNGETDLLARTFAAQNGLKVENVAVYAGSSEPLHYSVLAFTSPTRSFVTADPSYEAGMFAAKTSQAKIVKVALTADCAHDVKAMVAADPNAGVIYICNPNNPTGTLTTKQDIVWALENKPAGSILLVDEAYIHLTDAQDTLDLVAAGKDLIVLRTFSKIYGMAGIRCGFAVARPDLLAKLAPFGQNAMPITGSAAARASLEDAGLVATPEDHRRHAPRHHRLAEGQQLQGHRRSADQLLHDRHRPQRQGGVRGDEGQERPDRPHLAHLAQRRPRLGRHARGDGQVQGRLQGGHG
jgi:histidinol-phosphate aminotransferase